MLRSVRETDLTLFFCHGLFPALHPPLTEGPSRQRSPDLLQLMLAHPQEAVPVAAEGLSEDMSMDVLEGPNIPLQDPAVAPDNLPAVPAGIRPLDAVPDGGLWSPGMTVLAAHSSCGETGMALSIAENAAARGVKTLFLPVERNCAR